MKCINTMVFLTILFISGYSMAIDPLESLVSNGTFTVILPEASESNRLHQLEWSTNLVDWEPVARDFGDNWGNTFPHALQIFTNTSNQTLTDPTNGGQRFYRIVTQSTASLNHSNSVSRFLQQATFGATRDMINTFQGLEDPEFNNPPYSNFQAWIEAQISAPTNSHRAFWRERSNPAFTNNPANAHLYEVGHNPDYGHQLNYYFNGTVYKPDTNLSTNIPEWDTVPRENDVTFGTDHTKKIVWYHMAITADDQLRQRMAWALSQIFVVGEEGSNQTGYTERWTTYYDIFIRNAFGNFRDILQEVTYSPHMGYYLTFDSNKSLAFNGTYPDENYAREVMQLFTIGLWKLNQDGTHLLDAEGNPIPTYTNDDITEFAKIFTGLRRNNLYQPNYENGSAYTDPVRIQSSWHDWEVKTLLDGSTLGPFSQSEQAVRDVVDGLLDHLFNHPNTPPFIGRKLIQLFTISNPSPQYIYDVAQAFIEGSYQGIGTGTRGDLAATISAILLHPEAREPALTADSAHGKLREPLLRLLSYARSFNITSRQTYGFFPFYQLDEVFGQSPYDYPTVFNFYLPDYQPNGDVLDRDLYSPEFQIHNDITALSLPNAIWWLVYEGIQRDSEPGIGQRWYSQGDLDLAYETSLATNTAALMDHLDTMITAGRLTPENRATITTVIETMPNNDEEDREERVKKALHLFALLPEFNVIY